MIAFPSGWHVRPLGELVDVLDSRRIPVSARERAGRTGEVPYYGATGQVGWIDSVIFDEPLVLLGEDGIQFLDPSTSKSYLIDGPAWVNNHAHVLRPREFLDHRFLNYYLNVADYRGLANGTTRLKLTQSAMRRLPVPVPPLDQQHRIVDLLEDHFSRLDAAEASLLLAIRKADAMVTSSLATQTTGDESWRQSTVGTEAERVEYGSSAKCGSVDIGTEVPVLRMGNLKKGALVWDSLKYLPANHSHFPKLLLKPGDLLFNRTNSTELVGKSAVFSDSRTASFASYLIRVRFKHTADPAWVNMVINSPLGRRYVASVASQQVGQANVNSTKLKAFPLPLPTREEQVRRVREHYEVLSNRERLRTAINGALSQSVALRRSLLSAAFSDRLTTATPDLSEPGEKVDPWGANRSSCFTSTAHLADCRRPRLPTGLATFRRPAAPTWQV